MDKMIVADINLFTLASPVYLIENGKQSLLGTYKSEDMPIAIVACCRNHEVNHVKLNGIPAFNIQLMNSIQEEEMKEYSTNSIKIEVI